MSSFRAKWVGSKWFQMVPNGSKWFQSLDILLYWLVDYILKIVRMQTLLNANRQCGVRADRGGGAHTFGVCSLIIFERPE